MIAISTAEWRSNIFAMATANNGMMTFIDNSERSQKSRLAKQKGRIPRARMQAEPEYEKHDACLDRKHDELFKVHALPQQCRLAQRKMQVMRHPNGPMLKTMLLMAAIPIRRRRTAMIIVSDIGNWLSPWIRPAAFMASRSLRSPNMNWMW